MVTTQSPDMQEKSATSPPRLHLLVPALNEEANLPRLFAELVPLLQARATPWQLLVVDDGSTDHTAALVTEAGQNLPIFLRRHPRNLGPGAAFMTGFQALLPQAQPEDALVTLEADTTSDATLLPRMLDAHARGIDVVLASVYHPDGGLKHTTLPRRVLSTCANSLIRQAFQLEGIHTYSSFYRVYRARVLMEALTLYGRQLMAERGFASVVELLIKLARMGASLEEIPMVLDSTRRIGQSRMKVAKTAQAWIKLMIRLNLEPPPLPER